ncbi:MAG: oxidoreductase [Bacteroidetes bacterium]|nr:oxidoreductase [Bacteroidota bacterium]
MLAEIAGLRDESDLVRTFILRSESSEPWQFEPGQFVMIAVPGLPEHENLRSYSIASAPGSDTVELCIVLNPDGKATPVLWSMRVGDKLEISEPQGTFVLPETHGLELCLVCTGTGVAPFRSMIQTLKGRGKFPMPVYLIFGCRTESDLLYRKEWENLAEAEPNFRYIPVLSRQNWDGEKGYVHAVYKKLFADGRDARFMVCGWENMCTDARHNLKEMGYNRRQYKFENY